MDFVELETSVRRWAAERHIYKEYVDKAQVNKLEEEFNELKDAIRLQDALEIIDAIGDMMVVLTNIAYMETGQTLEYCYGQAYNQIKDRKGKMVNGTFVKEEQAIKCTHCNDTGYMMMHTRESGPFDQERVECYYCNFVKEE